MCSDAFEMVGGSRRWESPCTYDFYSSRTSKSGRFFSPNYPQNYPPDAVCLYYFYAQPGERVQISFNSIQLQPSADARYSADSINYSCFQYRFN